MKVAIFGAVVGVCLAAAGATIVRNPLLFLTLAVAICVTAMWVFS